LVKNAPGGLASGMTGIPTSPGILTNGRRLKRDQGISTGDLTTAALKSRGAGLIQAQVKSFRGGEGRNAEDKPCAGLQAGLLKKAICSSKSCGVWTQALGVEHPATPGKGESWVAKRSINYLKEQGDVTLSGGPFSVGTRGNKF